MLELSTTQKMLNGNEEKEYRHRSEYTEFVVLHVYKGICTVFCISYLCCVCVLQYHSLLQTYSVSNIMYFIKQS
jgi:hypothetical protein